MTGRGAGYCAPEGRAAGKAADREGRHQHPGKGHGFHGAGRPEDRRNGFRNRGCCRSGGFGFTAGEITADPDSRSFLEEEARILRARLTEVEALLTRKEGGTEKSGSDSPEEPEGSASL